MIFLSRWESFRLFFWPFAIPHPLKKVIKTWGMIIFFLGACKSLRDVAVTYSQILYKVQNLYLHDLPDNYLIWVSWSWNIWCSSLLYSATHFDVNHLRFSCVVHQENCVKCNNFILLTGECIFLVVCHLSWSGMFVCVLFDYVRIFLIHLSLFQLTNIYATLSSSSSFLKLRI